MAALKYADLEAFYGREVTRDTVRTANPNEIFEVSAGDLAWRIFAPTGQASQTGYIEFFKDGVAYNTGTATYWDSGVGQFSTGIGFAFSSPPTQAELDRIGYTMRTGSATGPLVAVFGNVGANYVYPVFPFSDNFDRTDRSLDGDNGWSLMHHRGRTTEAAAANIATNRAEFSGYAPTAIRDLGVTEYEISALSPGDGNNYPLLMWRIVDNANFFYIDGLRGEIRRVVGGTETALASTGLATPIWGVNSTIKVRVEGNVHSVFVNGTRVTFVTDAAHATATKVGLGHVSTAATIIWDDFNAAVVPTAPATPTGLTATGGAKQVATSWTASTGATGYRLRRGTTVVYDGTATSFTETGLLDETAYSYTISAYNGNGESAQSAAVSATTLKAFGDYAPTGLTATTNRIGEIFVDWDGINGNLKSDGSVNKGYELFRGGVSVYTGTVSEFLDKPLAQPSTHSYAVRSFRHEPDEAAPSVFFSDDFSAAAGTHYHNRVTPVGGKTWFDSATHLFFIDSSGGLGQDSNTAGTLRANAGVADMAVKAKMLNAINSGPQPAVRISDADNSCYLLGVFPTLPLVRLSYRNGSDTVTTLVDYTPPAALTAADVFVMRALGNTLTIEVNGVVVITHTMTNNLAATYAGFHTRGSGKSWDYLEVTAA